MNTRRLKILRAFNTGLMLGLLVGVACGQPAAEVRACIADLERNVPQAQWVTTRYLSQYNVAVDQRLTNARVASYVCNLVSRTATIQQPVFVAGTERRLVRINMAAYGLPHGVWEAMLESEPYFHILTAVKDPTTGKVKKVLVDGGWVGLAEAAKLRAMTGSGGAVCRMDWFVAKVSQPPHYYDFAGVPTTIGEWYKSLGADKAKIIELRANHGANMFTSGITKKPRRLSRYAGPLGGLWQTYDTEGTDPLKDPIRNPSFDGGFDASELIAARANGLHVFALYDAGGKRQDAVPDRIAKDDSDPHGDGIVRASISCIRCHGADGGLRSYTNDTADLMRSGVDILTGSPFDAESLSSFYLSDRLQKDLERDREDYASAVAKSTGGWTPKQAADALSSLFRSYEYEQVSPEQAAAQLGVADLTALRSSRDGVLLALAFNKKVQRRQFEQSYAEAAVLCGGKP